MFISEYIPVNVSRNNATVYSGSDVYPVDLLVKVHEALTMGNTNDVVVNDGNITILTQPDVKWLLTDFYLAYNAYVTALENKFSYYAVMNEHGVPALFISKQFNGQRILCNAYTMKSVVVSGKKYVSRISTMIDHTYPNKYCMNIYEVISNIMKGSAKYLSAVLVYKGNEDYEHLRISPIMSPYTDGWFFGYQPELINELREVIAGSTETSSLTVSKGMISYKEDALEEGYSLPPFTLAYAEEVVNLYDKILQKNVSYVPIYVETANGSEVHSYLSTDGTLLVNAETFECVKLRNMHTIKLFALYASCNCCNASELNLGWTLAKTEK